MNKWKEWVKTQHGDQKRKYTFEPYYEHLENVTAMLSKSDIPPMFMYAAYGHDLLEDTSVTEWQLYWELSNNHPFRRSDAFLITTIIRELTDVYTAEAFPQLNRKKRKELEAYRLWGVSPEAQTIKYCDLIDNLSSIVQHDQEFAEVYVREKSFVLQGMTKGDGLLFRKACDALDEACFTLELNQQQ